ncbi:Lrp/AsnC family transcriptional regulator [Amycolatopsis acidicola]|uniref:Lrp/AsnC family transcriptional regulator n=1 Tax=Amycolatopsis acidicola TaxID=2596893 RepID=A0A5N0V276_9PSEU|nr:Lrp/AsnC family transcriptional regulator [Amycolatopsis acidicola]KAA9157333.1 Lrp/AsnC family transcriptional regulator [Amycolatopsis acidicola]
MQDKVRLDELDRLLVNALQVSPRASWTQVASVLGVDAVTVARRWERLRESGTAWVTAYVGRPGWTGPLALVEIESAGNSLAVARRLVDDPECATIDITSGGRDLLLTVTAPDNTSLTDYLLHRLGSLEHARSVRTHIVTRVIAEGARWRLPDLTESQVARLTEPKAPAAATAAADLTDTERAILDCLVEDARIPATELAARTGLPVRRARDLLRAMLRSRRVTLRTELQSRASGWPIYAWFFLRVPSTATDKISPRLGSLPEIRTVLQVAGPSNVIMAVWLRELPDVSRLEAAIEGQLRDVEIIDRSVVLRTTKRIGVVLDDEGRRVRTVRMRMA